MDLISVIVPVYNVEKYLDRCVKSIVNQTYENLEIILVDDGATDNCPHLCDVWSERDCRIKVIHKENGGLSDARNAGLGIATGDYIAFIDSDDWVHTDYFRVLYTCAIESNSEIVACDLLDVYDNDIITDEKLTHSAQCYTPEEALTTLIEGNVFRAIACNKLFKRQLLENELFAKGRLHEDEFFTYRIIAKAKQLSYVNAKIYYYYQRGGSIMNSLSTKHFDVLNAYSERLLFFKNNFPSLYKKDKINIVRACMGFYKLALSLPKHEQKTCKRIVKRCRSKVKFTLPEFFEHSAKDVLYIFLTRCFIGMTARILVNTRKSQ